MRSGIPKHLIFVAAIFSLLCLPRASPGQETGSFSGIVLLDGMQVLSGATVSYSRQLQLILQPGGGYRMETGPIVRGSVRTGSDGTFIVTGVPKGEYNLCATGTLPTHLASCSGFGHPSTASVDPAVAPKLPLTLRVQSGAFVTFVVDDPAGLIRVNPPGLGPPFGDATNLSVGAAWVQPAGGHSGYQADYVSTAGSKWTYRLKIPLLLRLNLSGGTRAPARILDPQGQVIPMNTPSNYTFQAETSEGLTINLTVQPSGVVIQGAATNGASFFLGLSPGGIATVFDQGITSATGIFQASSLPLPTEINGTSVSINGARVPLYAVARVNGLEQVNFQVPSGLNVPGVNVVVSLNGVERPAISTNLFPVMPGIFTVDGRQGAIQHGTDFRLVTTNDPAIRGGPVIIYATGLGPVIPDPGAGNPAPASPPAITQYPVIATVGDVPAPVHFSGLTAGYAGLNQVNILIPTNAPTGEVDVVLSVLVDDLTFSSPPVKLSVQ